MRWTSPRGICPKFLLPGRARDAELCPTQLCLFERCPHRSDARKIEIGMIAADYAFGEAGGRAMGITLSLLLISTVSAMLMAGPRVLQVIGQTFIYSVVSQNKSRRYPHDCDLGGCTAQCGAGAVVKL